MAFFHFVLSSASSYSHRLSIALLHESFHQGFCLPLRQRQYLSTFTREKILQSLPSNYQQFPTMPMINIHPSGVKKLLDDLDNNKATGPDLIPTSVLKECGSILTHVLAELFQNSIDTGSVPDDWLTANVVGIYKKGDKQEPANYRPVSLASVKS